MTAIPADRAVPGHGPVFVPWPDAADPERARLYLKVCERELEPNAEQWESARLVDRAAWVAATTAVTRRIDRTRRNTYRASSIASTAPIEPVLARRAERGSDWPSPSGRPRLRN